MPALRSGAGDKGESMEPAYCSTTRLAVMVREREVTAVELLEYFLDRVARHDPALNAVVVSDPESAREHARAADAALDRGELWGPLHGIPMTVKETYELVGMPATAGAPKLREHYPQRNAVSVQRLVDAGAVIYGKTNTPLYAGDLQTYNEIYGTTNNPWDVTRTPGGSSGGSAVALAAGLTPLELGSDIGGSIRTPAAFCGVCGHKPSYGVLSSRGHIPGPPGTLARADISVAGPLARNVDDLELAMDLLTGPDAEDAPGWRLELPAARHRQLSEFRVGAWLDDPGCAVDAEVVQVLEGVVRRLGDAGVSVDSTARPPGVDLRESHELYYRLLTATMGRGLPEKVFTGMLRQAETAAPDAATADDYPSIFALGATQRHAQWLGLNERRQHLRAAWQTLFRDIDVLLCPVIHTRPFPHDHTQPMAERRLVVNGEDRPYMDVLVWAGLIGVAYLPSTVVPVGQTADGLPVGIQVVGPYLEDYTSLAFARHLEALFGGFRAPPGL